MPPYPISPVGQTESARVQRLAGWGSQVWAVDGTELVCFIDRVRQVLARLDDPFVRLAPDDEHLYLSLLRERRICRVPFFGGGLSEVTQTPDEPTELLVGEGLLVWIGRRWEIDERRGATYSTQRCVLRCARGADGVVHDVATLGDAAWSLGRDRERIYWLGSERGHGVRLWACALPALSRGPQDARVLAAWRPAPAVLATLRSRPSEDTRQLKMAVGQDDTLYWVDPRDRRLVALSTLGGRPRTVTTLPAVPDALAADATHVFAATPADEGGHRAVLAIHGDSGSVYTLARYEAHADDQPELVLAGGRLRWSTGRSVLSVSLTAIFGTEPTPSPVGVSDGLGTLGGWLEYRDAAGELLAHGMGPSTPMANIGRRESNDIVAPPSVGASREHARLRWRGGELRVEDLGATNGTHVNGLLLKSGREYRLRDGDRLCCGNFELVVRMAARAAAADMSATVPSIAALRSNSDVDGGPRGRSASPTGPAPRQMTTPDPEPLFSPERELGAGPGHGQVVSVLRERCPRSDTLHAPTTEHALKISEDEVLLCSALSEAGWVVRWERTLTLGPDGAGRHARCVWLVDAHGRRHPGWLPPDELRAGGMPCPVRVDHQWQTVTPGGEGWSLVGD